MRPKVEVVITADLPIITEGQYKQVILEPFALKIDNRCLHGETGQQRSPTFRAQHGETFLASASCIARCTKTTTWQTLCPASTCIVQATKPSEFQPVNGELNGTLDPARIRTARVTTNEHCETTPAALELPNSRFLITKDSSVILERADGSGPQLMPQVTSGTIIPIQCGEALRIGSSYYRSSTAQECSAIQNREIELLWVNDIGNYNDTARMSERIRAPGSQRLRDEIQEIANRIDTNDSQVMLSTQMINDSLGRMDKDEEQAAEHSKHLQETASELESQQALSYTPSWMTWYAAVSATLAVLAHLWPLLARLHLQLRMTTNRPTIIYTAVPTNNNKQPQNDTEMTAPEAMKATEPAKPARPTTTKTTAMLQP